MKFYVCPHRGGLRGTSLAAKPHGLAKPQALEAKQPAQANASLPKPPASVVADNRFVHEAQVKGTKEAPAISPGLPAGSPQHLRESLNRLDTRLCFALAREDLALKAQLLKQRRGIEAKYAGMDMDSPLPNKQLPTPALQSKKYTVELEIAKAQLQLHGKPVFNQVELKEALERELCRRIPGRQAEQAKDKTALKALSNSEFLNAYNTCAQQLYMKASMPETPYAHLLSSWGKWQIHTQEAKNRFGEAWLWQYV